MSTPKILVEAQGPVTTIIINRPQARNALDNEAAHGLAEDLIEMVERAGLRPEAKPGEHCITSVKHIAFAFPVMGLVHCLDLEPMIFEPFHK